MRPSASAIRYSSHFHLTLAGDVRILLVSDLHYTLRQFDWVVERAPAFDLVVLAGDQLDISSTVALDAQIVVVLHYLDVAAVGRPTSP